MIVDVEATPACTYDEVATTKTMIDRTEEILDLKPAWLIGDMAYETGQMLDWLIKRGVAPYIPVWDMSERQDGTLSRSDFVFDRENEVYVCPAGMFLRTTGTVHDAKTRLYRSRKPDCDACPGKINCCPNAPHRKIPRHVNEDARGYARALMGAPASLKSRDERKKIEMLRALEDRPSLRADAPERPDRHA